MKPKIWIVIALLICLATSALAGGFEFPSSDAETLFLGKITSVDAHKMQVTISVDCYVGPNDGSNLPPLIFKPPRPKVLIVNAKSSLEYRFGAAQMKSKALKIEDLKRGDNVQVFAFVAPKGKPAIVEFLSVRQPEYYKEYFDFIAHGSHTKTVRGK